MTPACAIVLAGLCLPAPYDKATDLVAMYAISGGVGRAQPAVIYRLGVKIDAIQADNLVPKAAEGVPETCVRTACVRYVKSCSPDGLVCQVEWGELTPENARAPMGPVVSTSEFILRAGTGAAMRATQQALFVEVRPKDGDPVYIPVASMSELSSTAYRPLCEQGENPPGCTNNYFGLLPDMRFTREQRTGLPPPAPQR